MTRTPGNPQPIALAKIIMAVAGIVLNVTPIAFWAAPSKIVFHLALLVRGGVYEVILLVTFEGWPWSANIGRPHETQIFRRPD
jgi:hypothetical protein